MGVGVGGLGWQIKVGDPWWLVAFFSYKSSCSTTEFCGGLKIHLHAVENSTACRSRIEAASVPSQFVESFVL